MSCIDFDPDSDPRSPNELTPDHQIGLGVGIGIGIERIDEQRIDEQLDSPSVYRYLYRKLPGSVLPGSVLQSSPSDRLSDSSNNPSDRSKVAWMPISHD